MLIDDKASHPDGYRDFFNDNKTPEQASNTLQHNGITVQVRMYMYMYIHVRVHVYTGQRYVRGEKLVDLFRRNKFVITNTSLFEPN